MHASSSGSITSLSVYPGLVKLSGNISSPLIACGTNGGRVEVYSMTKSRTTRLLLNLNKSFAIGDGEIKGIHWMGKTGKIVFYQSVEVKDSSSGDKSLSFRNMVHMLDVVTGQLDEIRSSVDSGEITGLRISPTGTYILIVCSGMASEIWTTLYLDSPFRLRQIDLPFSTVEWLPEGFGLPSDTVHDGKENNPVELSSSIKTPFDALDDLPEEMLHFSLRDSRLGILLVKGRKIQDARPVVSNWAPLVTGEFQAVCAAAFGSYIFLGGNDGTLARWDTKRGDTVAVETGCAKVVRIQVAGPKSDGEDKICNQSSSIYVMHSRFLSRVLILQEHLDYPFCLHQEHLLF
jgi:WD40 repeat protein